jgi:hypothetical protein
MGCCTPFSLVEVTDISEVLAACIAQMMEAASTSEMPVNSTRLHGADDSHLFYF